MKPCIGLVVPSLTQGGGVPSVARFVRDIIQRSARYELVQVSLSTSARDPCNVSLRNPRTWIRGPVAMQDEWEGSVYTHIGAVAGELEFQRYRPHATLAHALKDCDLVQVVCGSPAWANAVLGLGMPVALQVATRARVERRQRNAAPRSMVDWWRMGMTSITDRLDDRALRRVDAIQVENPWMLDYVREINTGRTVDVRYAPPGIDAQWFKPTTATKRLEDPYILCVGRLDDPRKNIALLLKAYACLPGKVRDGLRLVLAGSTAPPASFWQLAKDLGIADKTHYVASPDADRLRELFRHANVFALPSDEEGLGVVLLEAMACGVPVVSTRSGGPDGIISDGHDGYLVPLDDAATMATRLHELLRDRQHNITMGERARQTIERRYDECVAGEAFLDMWDRLLNPKEPPACAD